MLTEKAHFFHTVTVG